MSRKLYINLRKRMLEAGLNQRELARVTGMSTAVVSHRLCGRSSWTLQECYMLLEKLECKPEDIFKYFPPSQMPKSK